MIPPNPYRSPLGVPVETPGVVPPTGAAAPLEEVPKRPWGFWATILWSLLVAVVFLVVQTAVAVAFVVPLALDGHFNVADAEKLESNGLLLSLSTLASAPAVVGLVWLLARLRGWRPRDYLALRAAPARAWAGWFAAAALLIAAIDLVTWLCGREIVPPVMVEAYRTAGFLPLFLLALIVAAPVSEELFFRGFLFRGLAASRLGAVGTILATAAVFAVVHLQYDGFGVATIAVAGVFLGVARWQTGSTTLTIALHAFQNLVATVEIAIVSAQGP